MAPAVLHVHAEGLDVPADDVRPVLDGGRQDPQRDGVRPHDAHRVVVVDDPGYLLPLALDEAQV